MKEEKNNIESEKAETSKEMQHKHPTDGVNPQEREQQARKQQEQDRREVEPHSSDAKDALRQKTRQGLNNR